jgi:hypothetical protein
MYACRSFGNPFPHFSGLGRTRDFLEASKNGALCTDSPRKRA